MNVKNMVEAVRIAARLAKLFESCSGDRLRSLVIERGKHPRQGGEVGDAAERGFQDGLKAGVGIAKFDVADLPIEGLLNAFYGTE